MGNQNEFTARTPDRELKVIDHRHTAQAPVVQDSGSNDPIVIALNKGYSPEFIEKMMDLRERDREFRLKEKAELAREAFYEAKAAFKAEAPPIKKDKWNDWLKCWYTSLGQLLDTYNPCLGKHGLSVSFAPPQQDDKTMTVECRLAHRMGHVETVSMTGPIDKAAVGKQSGQKSRNDMQDLRSTFTYLRATTLEAILGVSGTEATKDDDGNGAGKQVEYINLDQQTTIIDRIGEIYQDGGLRYFKWLSKKTNTDIDGPDKIPTSLYGAAIQGLDDAEAALNKIKKSREPGEEG